MRVALVILLAACAPKHPRIEWGVRQEDHAFYREGTCPTALRVRVVDPQQHPVTGAEVIVRQTMHTSMPSTQHTTTVYETAPVVTGPDGVAKTCLPDRVPPRNEHEMFVSYRGEIRAHFDDRSGVLAAPFTEPLVLDRVRPPTAAVEAP